MSGEIPTYVGYRITEGCNAGPACISRCFSQEEVLFDDPQLEQVFETLDILRELGVQSINIMGGEPTQRNDLVEIVRYAHDTLGFETVLSTNALLLDASRLDALEPHISWLSLSLDGDTKSLNDALRGKGQWDAALRVRDWFGLKNRSVRWKVNTQINAVNIGHIGGIPDVLGTMDVWKLLQWTPRAEASRVIDRYAIPPQEYTEVVAQMRSRYPRQTIVERPYPETEPDTGIVRPNGDFEVNAGPFSYVVVGNILKERPVDVLSKAATIYQQFPEVNTHEFHESYPVRIEGGL